MTDAFDIGSVMTTETDELAIVNPATGEPTTWVWTLAGPGHPASVAASDAAAREANALNKRRQEALINRKTWSEPALSTDEVKRDNARTFAARVLGWTPAKIDGQDYSFSKENAVALLLNPNCGRIYVQLLQYFNDEASFTKRSATTSQPSPSATSV